MVAWGLNPFEDDDCRDFFYELRADGVAALDRAIRDSRYKDSRPEQHAEGYAAAYVIAAILTKDAEAVGEQTLKLEPSKELQLSAAAAMRLIGEYGDEYLQRRLGMGSEVVGLWGKQFAIMAAALGFDPEMSPRSTDRLSGNAPAEQEAKPGSWQHQRLVNLHLLETRHQMGDDFEAIREVDHTFICRTEKIANAVFARLGKWEWQVKAPEFVPSQDSQESYWLVEASLAYAPDFAGTWNATLEAFDAAKTTGASYDGWGAPIIPKKKKWFGR